MAFAIVFSSCSKDDAPDTSGDLVGTWKAVSVDYSGTETHTVRDAVTETTITGKGYKMNYELTFSETPNDLTSQGKYSVKETRVTNGEETKQNLGNQKLVDNGTWAKTNAELEIAHFGKNTSLKIVKLSDSELILEKLEKEELTIGRRVIKTRKTTTITFEKQ